MERMIFILPICEAGTPEHVDYFLKSEKLEGSSFATMDDAELHLIELKEKYKDHEFYKNFGIFEITAYADKSECGHKVTSTIAAL